MTEVSYQSRINVPLVPVRHTFHNSSVPTRTCRSTTFSDEDDDDNDNDEEMFLRRPSRDVRRRSGEDETPSASVLPGGTPSR